MIPPVPGRGHIGLDKAGDFRQIALTGSRPQWFGSRARRDWLRALTLFGPQAGKGLTRNPDQSNDSCCRPLLGDLFGFLRFGKIINISQPETKQRELRSLQEAMEQLDLKRGTILTWLDEGSEDGIEILPVWKWLLTTEGEASHRS